MTKERTEHWLDTYASKATPEQRSAIAAEEERVLLIAGPGSGKTSTIIWRILYAIDNHTPPESIVCVTFTNAAAREIKKRLGNLRLGFIGTLHALCLRLLRTHGHRIGYGPQIAIVDAERQLTIMSECAKALGVKAKPEDLLKWRDSGQKIKSNTPEGIAIATYVKRLRAQSAVDFRLLLEDGLRAITNTETPRQPFPEMEITRLLLVDEYQDSAPIDAEIYDALLPRQTFLVGDPDQAIYGFRGATIDNIMIESFRSDTRTIRLDQNFRSDIRICDAANLMIKNNSMRVEKRTRSMTRGMGRVLTIEAPTEDAEAEAIAREIKLLIDREGFPAEEIAVLARTNAIACRIGEYLRDACGLPVVETKRPAKGDRKARAALAVLCWPRNEIAASQWLEIDLGAEQAAEIRAEAARTNRSICEALAFKTPEWSELLNALGRMGLSRDEIEIVKRAMEAMPDNSLPALAASLAQTTEEIEPGRGIAVTTMHAAKGREWDHVFLAGMEEETTPGRAAREDLEEERRIVFVGMTRARHNLTIAHAATRRASWGRKAIEPRTRSRFVSEALD